MQGIDFCTFTFSQTLLQLFVRLLSWDHKSNLEISQVCGIEEISSLRRRLRGFEGCVPWPKQISIVLCFSCHSSNYTLELLRFVIVYLFR